MKIKRSEISSLASNSVFQINCTINIYTIYSQDQRNSPTALENATSRPLAEKIPSFNEHFHLDFVWETFSNCPSSMSGVLSFMISSCLSVVYLAWVYIYSFTFQIFIAIWTESKFVFYFTQMFEVVLCKALERTINEISITPVRLLRIPRQCLLLRAHTYSSCVYFCFHAFPSFFESTASLAMKYVAKLTSSASPFTERFFSTVDPESCVRA